MWHDSFPMQYNSFSMRKLIERNPPPRGGFLFTMFPDQEPCARDFTTRCDRRISSWNVLHTALDQVITQQRNPPRGGGGSCDQSNLRTKSQCLVCRYMSHDSFSSLCDMTHSLCNITHSLCGSSLRTKSQCLVGRYMSHDSFSSLCDITHSLCDTDMCHMTPLVPYVIWLIPCVTQICLTWLL